MSLTYTPYPTLPLGKGERAKFLPFTKGESQAGGSHPTPSGLITRQFWSELERSEGEASKSPHPPLLKGGSPHPRPLSLWELNARQFLDRWEDEG